MSDPLADIERAITAIRFAEIVDDESKCTIVVPPHLLDRVRWLVEQHGGERRFTVQANPNIPEDQVFILDVNALNATNNALGAVINEMLARPIRWQW